MSISIERLGAWLDQGRFEEAASASPNDEEAASPNFGRIRDTPTGSCRVIFKQS